MKKLKENTKRTTLEENIVGNMVPFYKHKEEEHTVQPVLAKQLASSSSI